MSFPKNFIWGASSAAIQIEGAWNEDGKTPNIWDVMPKERLTRGETCHTACDHYHRWKEDVELMKEIGLKAYRFSINWPRVIPARGEINEKGLSFYRNLVDALVQAGIEPVITLHHAELPQWAFETGGWGNEEIVEAFAEFTKVMVETLSDKVQYWITMNEPQCFSGDYLSLDTEADENQVTRNIMLAHGRAVQTIRQYAVKRPQIGLTIMGISMMPVEGITDEESAMAMTFSEMIGRMGMGYWMNPIILGEIPDALKGVISEEDIKTICQPLDMFAANVYFAGNYAEMPGRENPLMYPGMPKSMMGWSVNDELLYHFAKMAWKKYKLPVLFTENGFANLDFVMLDGKVHDPQRIDYMHRYLIGLKRAVDEGIPVIGYLYWSIMDNYEWFHGYDKRFGLIYVDYTTQKRTLKDSAYYYAEVIKTNGDNLDGPGLLE